MIVMDEYSRAKHNFSGYSADAGKQATAAGEPAIVERRNDATEKDYT